MWPKLQVLLQGRSVPRILISYRRRDSAAITGRLYDRLVQKYGANSLFLDIDNIPYGPDFRQHVRDALSQTDLVLLVIGPDWVGRRTGRLPRIADDNDPVRIEIETTLQAKIPLLPILVDGASPPDERELPSSLHDQGNDFRRRPQLTNADMGADGTSQKARH
jgi:TIR domain